MNLTDFLLARIAEDEAVARDAIAPPNMYPWGDRSLPMMSAADWPDALRGYLGGAWGEHGARWNPTRVLAECEAKRAIVEHYEGGQQVDSGTYACKFLALPYADHPDYDQAWRP